MTSLPSPWTPFNPCLTYQVNNIYTSRVKTGTSLTSEVEKDIKVLDVLLKLLQGHDIPAKGDAGGKIKEVFKTHARMDLYTPDKAGSVKNVTEERKSLVGYRAALASGRKEE
ncbi:hypothetical protein BX616_008151 [Lobosporangium transversale]|nr:hypothetical protein BX616_008151 [Lobosporangium transversale]